jgi:hypothetical protein
MDPEVNDHVNLQWPSYEQPLDSNLRPQREQTSWSQALTTGPPPRWFIIIIIIIINMGVWIRVHRLILWAITLTTI